MSGPWDHYVLFAASALLAGAATAGTRFAAIRLGLLAEPNRRSSHTTPTPTAGGIGFVLPVVGFLILSINDHPPALVLATAGVAIALIGFLDDVKDLRRDVRLVVHLATATGCVALLTDEPVLVTAVLILGLAWWINLYNFMDGIDGIAASQSVIYAGGVLVIGEPVHSATTVWVLLGASLGFLCFNWAPAKIFMGDTGSGFLGVAIGSLALMLWQSGELPAVASLILLVGFWFDASYTLGVRIVTRQPFRRRASFASLPDTLPSLGTRSHHRPCSPRTPSSGWCHSQRSRCPSPRGKRRGWPRPASP